MQTAEKIRPVADRAHQATEEKEQKFCSENQLRTLTGLLFLPLAVITWHHARDYWMPMRGFLDQQIYFKHFVTLLFVVCGFTVASQYDLKTVGSSAHFYFGRIARLWPIHAACLVLLLVSISEVFIMRGQWFPIFLSNLFMVQTWIPMAQWYWSYNSPSYATSTLLWCEIAFPLLCIGARRSKALTVLATGVIVLAVIGISNALHLPGDALTHASLRGLLYASPLARLFEFTVGVVAALTSKQIASRLKLSFTTATLLEAGAIALVAYVNTNSSAWSVASTRYIGDAGAFWLHNSGDNLLPLALLVAVLATARGAVSKFFGSRVMVFLGEISIAFYMLHAVFSAYFYANFLEERSLLPAAYFFGSLFVAAHLVHVCIFEPIRKQFVKQGAKLLALKWPAPPEYIDGAASAGATSRGFAHSNQMVNKIGSAALLALEAAVAAVLFYMALPTVQFITLAEAQSYDSRASVHQVHFSPWLECRSAQAECRDGQVIVKTVWQPEKSQSIDCFITSQVVDQSGTVLGSSRYAMDGRHQKVRSGALWCDTAYINFARANAKPVKVHVKLTHGKKAQLKPEADNAQQVDHTSMIVPITASSIKQSLFQSVR